MSRNVNRLHSVTILISSLASLKSIVIPGIIILLGRGFHYSLNPSSKQFIATLSTIAITLFVLIVILIAAYIKWKRFVYWFEDEELRIEYGLFVKKKRYIPFERIQSLNYKEGIFHRPLKLVKVSIETAADSGGKSEADLTAITRTQADAIDQEMKKAKKQFYEKEQSESDVISSPPNHQTTVRASIHRMSKKDLLLLATTSSSIGVVFSGVAAIMSQFGDWIRYDAVFGELQSFVKLGIIMVIIAVFIFLLISWLLSVAITFVSYYGFVVEKEEDKLFISKGLLEKKRVTIPMKRIQGIRIVENPFRQLFGYSTIVIESAGSSGDKDEKRIVLLPLVKKQQAFLILENLFPEAKWNLPLRRAPKRAKRRYLLKYLYWLTPIAAIVSFFAFPYGLWALIILPLALILGACQYKSAGYAISQQQLTVVYRGISKTTFVTFKERLQAISLSQSYLAKRKNLGSMTVHIMSGSSGSIASIKHFDQKTLEGIFEWYRPNVHSLLNQEK